MSLAEKFKEEVLALIPPTVFFFVALHIVAYVRMLMLEGTGIPLTTSATITIAALILGKAVLIADLLPVINRYPGKPLIFNIAWKTAIYFVIALGIHYLERLFEFRHRAGGLAGANRALLDEIVWPHWWAINILLLLLILMYCTMHELVRVIGKERMRDIFFGVRA